MTQPYGIGINGFGRIGRLFLRTILENQQHNLRCIAINTINSSPEQMAILFLHDSIHGAYPYQNLEILSDRFIIDGTEILCFQQKDTSQIPWGELNINLIAECSGKLNPESLQGHIAHSERRLLISAPYKEADFTVVYGINHNGILPQHRILSNASCTTNCLAPAVHVLLQSCGILSGHFSTIHAITGDQNLTDASHKDHRRARAAYSSIIPTTTGASQTLFQIFPSLFGKITGTSLRVPVANVSLVDFTFIMEKDWTIEEINQAFEKASRSLPTNVLGYNKLPLVSCDFNHSPYSCIFDATQTTTISEKMARILLWYDNEWAFACRMLDLALFLQSKNT